ncbi:MAG TPA: hypothetical protein VGQ41_20235 [Pyrinomonadaceae bacterium]|jgi:hypothetical protein|nr:hypothetical protein [Pyrinomonadaceae bacterium]
MRLTSLLLTIVVVATLFESAGFKLLAEDVIVQEIAPNYVAYAERLATGADSILASLTRNEFDAGMTALRSYARSNNDPVTEPIDVFVFRS